MKKKTFILTTLVAALALTGCSSTKQMARFTSVENLFVLKPGITYEKMLEQLESKPYDIYFNQENGYVIYEYKYRTIERKIDKNRVNYRGAETVGEEIYARRLSTVLLFFKDNKLETFITDKGEKNGSWIVWLNNTLYTVAKDKEGKYIFTPDKGTEKLINGGIFGSKKKK